MTSLKKPKFDADQDKFVERLYEDALEQKRGDEVKGYENHGFDTSSKSSLLFVVKW